jgi:BA14K-like protein
MQSLVQSMIVAAVCSMSVMMAEPPASASAASSAVRFLQSQPPAANSIEQVQYRQRDGGRRYRGGRGGEGIALGIGAAIIGGIILSEAARAEHRQSHGSQWQRCADTYRSFEGDTGLYTGYDGARHTCPYLR